MSGLGQVGGPSRPPMCPTCCMGGRHGCSREKGSADLSTCRVSVFARGSVMAIVTMTMTAS
jgi:hypothetical protein